MLIICRICQSEAEIVEETICKKKKPIKDLLKKTEGKLVFQVGVIKETLTTKRFYIKCSTCGTEIYLDQQRCILTSDNRLIIPINRFVFGFKITNENNRPTKTIYCDHRISFKKFRTGTTYCYMCKRYYPSEFSSFNSKPKPGELPLIRTSDKSNA